jgi:hypothetical protein
MLSPKKLKDMWIKNLWYLKNFEFYDKKERRGGEKNR